MDWYQRLNAAVDYIEENLSGKVDYAEAADRAYCSVFHFYRMFSAISGMTPAEYTRNRRLSLAAGELLSTDEKVIDLSMKYGYDSPSAFSKAFRNLHGVTPQQARQTGVTTVALSRIAFPVRTTGGRDMDYRIIGKPAFDIVGCSAQFGVADGEFSKKGRTYWSKYVRTGEYRVLCDLTGGKDGPVTRAGILTAYMPDANGRWDPVVNVFGVEKTDEMNTDGFEVFHIPEATYAEFNCTLDNSVEINNSIYSEWFTSAGYEHAGTPDIAAFSQLPWNRTVYVRWWIPVVRKS
ncbi:MAG: AraC family transcriptional regulator [Dehalococcoidales bacterium]|nr:AraC family transcriptional regulator [Dehalococcoidales bacterium]